MGSLCNIHVKLLAFDFLTLVQNPSQPNIFLRKGVPLSRFETLGVVVSRELKPNRFLKFLIDDGTGCIPCVFWLNQLSSPFFSRRNPSDVRIIAAVATDSASKIRIGVAARVRGRITAYRGELQITVSDVVVVDRDPNAEILHWLDCLSGAELDNDSTDLRKCLQVALKTTIVVHRALREGDPTFREELLNFSQRGRILQLSNFKDDSSSIGTTLGLLCLVRTYALFLEEQLKCFRILKYDIEADRLPRPAQGQEKGYSRTRDLDGEELLEHLPSLQQLLYRLIGCRPEGAAFGNYVIQYALALVLKESFKIYCAVNDGIINLIDKFFEMPRHEAIKALEIYKRAGQQAGSLSDFYEVCKGLELARNFQFPVLREPPQSFLATMEEYIREAPRMVSAPRVTLEFPERLQLTYRPEEFPSPSEEAKLPSDEPEPLPLDIVPVSNVEFAPLPSNNFDNGDLLGLNINAPDASTIEESNALALAIVSSDTAPSFNSSAVQAKEFDPTGWELALVSAPSTDISSVNERQLAGGLDSMTLSSLYDEGAYRAAQQPVYGAPAPNPFEVQDPFALSNSMAPPTAVQMAAMSQHQQANPFGSYQATYQQQMPQQQMMVGAPNPFGDAGFGAFPAAAHPQNNNNPFGSTGLL